MGRQLNSHGAADPGVLHAVTVDINGARARVARGHAHPRACEMRRAASLAGCTCARIRRSARDDGREIGERRLRGARTKCRGTIMN